MDKKEKNNKSVYIGLIVFASFLYILFHQFDNGGSILRNLSELFGSFIPIILVSYLISKYTNKEANKELKLKKFSITFSILILVILVGAFLK